VVLRNVLQCDPHYNPTPTAIALNRREGDQIRLRCCVHGVHQQDRLSRCQIATGETNLVIAPMLIRITVVPLGVFARLGHVGASATFETTVVKAMRED